MTKKQIARGGKTHNYAPIKKGKKKTGRKLMLHARLARGMASKS